MRICQATQCIRKLHGLDPLKIGTLLAHFFIKELAQLLCSFHLIL